MDTVESSVTNEEVGKLLGLSHSMVSRLRSGNRGASFDTMMSIERKLGWMVEAQVRSRAAGRWGLDFEAELVRKYGSLVHEAKDRV